MVKQSTSSAARHTLALIVRTRPLRDADLLVTLIGEREGKFFGVAPQARRSRRRFGAALESGTIGEVVYRERPGQDLVGLDEVHIIQAPPRETSELTCFAAFGIILNIIEIMSMERQAAPQKFLLMRHSLSALAKQAPSTVLIHFLIHWLIHSGFVPLMDRCGRCAHILAAEEGAIFAPVEGGALCERCGRSLGWSMPLSPAVRANWLQIAGAKQCSSQPPSAELQKFCRSALWQYLIHIIDKPLNAAPYWEMAFQA